MKKLKRLLKSRLQSIASFLLRPVFATHRHFVNKRRPYAKIEAVAILAEIDSDEGRSDADAVLLPRLAHLLEHYGIKNTELGIVDDNDLRHRISMSQARAAENPTVRFRRRFGLPQTPGTVKFLP
jgi:predicted metal-dependent TIM-barrel fold hydrolase